MKIVVIYDATPGAQVDPEVKSALGITRDVHDVERILKNKGFETETIGFNFPVLRCIESLLSAKADVVFNLCEGLGDDSAAEIYVASLLELLKIPFTGSGSISLSLCHDKGIAKRLLNSSGIPTPKHIVVEPGNLIHRNGLEFPLIVKPIHEDGSFGIEDDSVVHSDKALKTKASWIHQAFHQGAMIEEFIDGREFNVSILGNIDYDFVQLREIQFSPSFEPHIVSFNAKWKKSSLAYQSTLPIEHALLNENIKHQMLEYAMKCYELFKIRDYGRIDFRLGGSGVPYCIDINPNPCISRDSGMVKAASQQGMTYEDLIGKITSFALERGQRHKGGES